MRGTVVALIAAAAVVLPAAASAHVTVQPTSAEPGSFTRIDIRVPTERDDASTRKVDVQLPDGFVFVSYQPVPGWTVEVTKEKLAKPLKSDEGEEISDQVKRITWTGHGRAGRIAPNQFMDFPLSVQVPDAKAGTKLTFKALQTYSNGEVARWIGPPDAEEPAPQLTLARPVGEGAAATASAHVRSSNGDGDGGSDGLAIVALIVGGLGLLTGLGALAAARRGRRAGA